MVTKRFDERGNGLFPRVLRRIANNRPESAESEMKTAGNCLARRSYQEALI